MAASTARTTKIRSAAGSLERVALRAGETPAQWGSAAPRTLLMTTLFTAAFRQACAGDRCPLCVLALQASDRYLGSLLHEYALAADIHRRLALSRGLCAAHARRLCGVALAEEGDGLGVATLYGSVLQSLRADLDAVLERVAPAPRTGPLRRPRPRWSAGARETLAAGAPCPVCTHRDENERFALAQWLDHLADSGVDDDLAIAYRQGAGACLPHLLALLERSPEESVARWLVAVRRDRLAHLADELERYVRGHDIRTSDPMDEAREAVWIRALEATGGL